MFHRTLRSSDDLGLATVRVVVTTFPRTVAQTTGVILPGHLVHRTTRIIGLVPQVATGTVLAPILVQIGAVHDPTLHLAAPRGRPRSLSMLQSMSVVHPVVPLLSPQPQRYISRLARTVSSAPMAHSFRHRHTHLHLAQSWLVTFQSRRTRQDLLVQTASSIPQWSAHQLSFNFPAVAYPHRWVYQCTACPRCRACRR